MRFDPRFFEKMPFTEDQVRKNLDNSVKDLGIARRVDIPDVKFNYAYTALIKAGIALLSRYKIRVRSVPGHQVKVIAKLAQILEDDSVGIMGDLMRSKRNRDLYAGGIEVTEKECREYLEFVEKAVEKAASVIFCSIRSLEEGS